MANIRQYDTSLTGPDCRELTYRLMNEKNFLPDIYHDYPIMIAEYSRRMSECCQPFALVDGKNQLGGMFFISDIVPGHEATFYVWVWNPKCYTATTSRFMAEYIEHYAEEYGLSRVVCRTPDDKKCGRMLEKLFFKLEGRFRNGWKGGGRLSTLFCYRRLFSGGV
jgi:RimJ/RimL family protein N-acetyltransferase